MSIPRCSDGVALTTTVTMRTGSTPTGNCTNNMDSDVSEYSKRSVQEYTQHDSKMVGNRGYQGIQYGRSQTS